MEPGEVVRVDRCNTCRRAIVLWRLGQIEWWRHMTDEHEAKPTLERED